MKNAFIILVFFITRLQMFSQSSAMVPVAVNYTSFIATTPTVISAQLENETPLPYKANPEYGVLPLNTSCSECVELIHKRTEYTREYVSGSKVCTQTGYNKINYLDSNGFYREINPYLYPTAQSNIYAALKQPAPTYVDLNTKKLVINYNGNRFSFARNLKLIFQDSLGLKSTLATADWSQATVGKEGVFITDIFPGIDFEANIMVGSFKTSFLIKSAINIPSKGWLIISDDLDTDFSSSYNLSGTPDADGKVNGNLFINAANNNNFAVLQGIVAGNKRGNFQPLYYRMLFNKLEMLSSSNWLNDTATKYPVSIDPVVTNSGTLAQASITGSGLNNFGSFVGFCAYNLTVARPANCTLNDIQWTYSYIAKNGSWRSEGAVDFLLGACRSPAGAGFYWFCNVNSGGICNGVNVTTGTDLLSCVSPIAACSGNLTFTMRFYDAYGGTSCSNVYIGANSAWTMSLFGNNLQTLGNAATGNGSTTQASTCYGSTTLNPAVTNGVPGYTYLWSGGQTSSTITYTPTAPGSTVFSCVVTDACGVVRTATFTVTNNCVLPVELMDYSASYNGNYASVNWTTASEKNADYFTIEHAFNGIDYTLIEKVSAAGNSTSQKKYLVKDFNPNKKGVNYYRLKQIDTDGKERYSKVVTLDIVEETVDVKLIPNPASNDLDVELSNKFYGRLVNIELYDVMGRKHILKQNINISNENKKIHLDIGDLPQGTYFINLITEDFTVYKNKLIKF